MRQSPMLNYPAAEFEARMADAARYGLVCSYGGIEAAMYSTCLEREDFYSYDYSGRRGVADNFFGALCYTLRHFGIEVADIRTLTPFIGPPLQQSFRDLYGLAPGQMAEAHQAYEEYYLARGMYENVPYAGMADLLARLRQAGKHLYVATSKPEPLARRILEYFGLIGHFDFVGGDTPDWQRSAKEQVIRHVLASCPAIDPEQAVMVGDRRYDIAGAHANGLAAIGVLYGYGSREELAEAGADCIVRDLEELERVLTE